MVDEYAKEIEKETFEEANDFDVDDDIFPVSPHEYSEDQESSDMGIIAEGQKLIDEANAVEEVDSKPKPKAPQEELIDEE